MSESQERLSEELTERINDALGHDGKDGTYIYCLTRVKEAFHYGTMTIDDFVEVDEEFTQDLVVAAMKVFAPILAERDRYKAALEELKENLPIGSYARITAPRALEGADANVGQA